MTEWITAISSFITAATILLIWWQFKADHERSRRENSINLSKQYVSSISRRTASAFRFAEALDAEKARNLYRIEPFTVDVKFRPLIVSSTSGILEDIDLPLANSDLKLSVEAVSIIRWEVITHLNSIEAVLMSWRHNVADKDLIEEQFSHMISTENGYCIVENFRIACGGYSAYPSIHEFVEHIKNRQKPELQNKKRIA